MAALVSVRSGCLFDRSADYVSCGRERDEEEGGYESKIACEDQGWKTVRQVVEREVSVGVEVSA